MKISLTLRYILCAFGLVAVSANAFDVDKEQRIAQQTLETLFIGEPLWLNTGGGSKDDKNKQFLSLLSSVDDAKGSIILIHGTGLGPDTPFVIGPLRELLADNGYTTLALQMPVLAGGNGFNEYSREFPESEKRISAAINYLKDNDEKNIMLLAHSLGSTMMMDWVDQNNVNALSGLISLGLGTSNTKGKIANSILHIPLLDIIGESDYQNVLTAAELRKKNILKTNKHSKQVVIDGLDHFYTDHENKVVDVILDWFTTLD
ncbi:MAG: pimeloyl-ACP methyl ester carboxylesterase [Arenicella sp.]